MNKRSIVGRGLLSLLVLVLGGCGASGLGAARSGLRERLAQVFDRRGIDTIPGNGITGYRVALSDVDLGPLHPFRGPEDVVVTCWHLVQADRKAIDFIVHRRDGKTGFYYADPLAMTLQKVREQRNPDFAAQPVDAILKPGLSKAEVIKDLETICTTKPRR